MTDTTRTWIILAFAAVLFLIFLRLTRNVRLEAKSKDRREKLLAELEQLRRARPPREQVLRPPATIRTDEEVEADREAYLSQELFFSRIRWEAHLSHAEVARLKRLPIQGLTHMGIIKMIEEQENECFYCRAAVTITDHHKDHLIPLAMWGPNHIDNIVIACSACNLEKGARDPFHFLRVSKRPLRDAESLKRLVSEKIKVIRGHIPDWVGEWF